jgi:hypothetical protein
LRYPRIFEVFPFSVRCLGICGSGGVFSVHSNGRASNWSWAGSFFLSPLLIPGLRVSLSFALVHIPIPHIPPIFCITYSSWVGNMVFSTGGCRVLSRFGMVTLLLSWLHWFGYLCSQLRALGNSVFSPYHGDMYIFGKFWGRSIKLLGYCAFRALPCLPFNVIYYR